MTKDDWRVWARRAAARIDWESIGERVRAHIDAWLPVDAAVLTFLPMEQEPDLRAMIDQRRQWFVTRTPDSGPLTIHRAGVPLERHRFGFDQPDGTAAVVSITAVDVALAPGLAFSERGVRLGHGVGYYDELLARLASGTKIVGVTASKVVVPELPQEAHDVLMTHLATESGVHAVRP